MSTQTTTLPATHDDASRHESLPSSHAAGATELASKQISLRSALRQFPDFPIPGINFVDILPLFADPVLHESLLRCLELQVAKTFGDKKIDVVVGLDARGFLFGPSLALRLGAGFAPVRKAGKLPGPTEQAAFQKEYGQDFFHIQKDAVKPGQTVLVVDDIIATGESEPWSVAFCRTGLTWTKGGSAAAAGSLVEQLGGVLAGYLFILEIDFLKGRDKLNAPVETLLRDDMKD